MLRTSIVESRVSEGVVYCESYAFMYASPFVLRGGVLGGVYATRPPQEIMVLDEGTHSSTIQRFLNLYDFRQGFWHALLHIPL